MTLWGIHNEPSPPAQVLALNSKRANLMKRISQRQARHEAIGDLQGRLRDLTVREIRAQLRWERQQRKLAS